MTKKPGAGQRRAKDDEEAKCAEVHRSAQKRSTKSGTVKAEVVPVKLRDLAGLEGYGIGAGKPEWLTCARCLRSRQWTRLYRVRRQTGGLTATPSV